MEKKDITKINLVGIKSRTSNSYGRNMPYMRYEVICHYKGSDGQPSSTKIQGLFDREELKKIPYWSTRSNSMSMTCWGTSQLFEAQISLGRWLGFDEKNWSDFCRKCQDFIKEI